MFPKAKELDMVQPDSQWLYVIVNSVVSNATNITVFTEFLSEGVNVAFAYNSTDSDTYCDVIDLIVPCFVTHRFQSLEKYSHDFRLCR